MSANNHDRRLDDAGLSEPDPALVVTAIRAYFAPGAPRSQFRIWLMNPGFKSAMAISAARVPEVTHHGRWHRLFHPFEVGSWLAPESVLGLEFRLADGSISISRARPERKKSR